MLAMAVPMILLFEAAIQVARVLDKRRAKRDAIAGFHDIADDEASPLDASPSRLDERPVLEPPEPIDEASAPPDSPGGDPDSSTGPAR